MKAKEINEYFLDQAPWINRSETLDRIIIGNPEKEIKTVLVCWMSTLSAIEYAIKHHFDMVITHEPTFWIHQNELENLAEWGECFEKYDAVLKKKKLIEDHDLVVLRNHDVWDAFPKVGIPWALAQHLELGSKPIAMNANNMQHRYDIEPLSLGSLAKRIANRTALLGEPQIQVFGDLSMEVSKLGIGTGCCCQVDVFRDLGCDVSLVCDDGNWYWQQLTWAQEINHPVIRINHAISEEPGMITMTKYINDHLDGIEAQYFPHQYKMTVVSAKG